MGLSENGGIPPGPTAMLIGIILTHQWLDWQLIVRHKLNREKAWNTEGISIHVKITISHSVYSIIFSCIV